MPFIVVLLIGLWFRNNRQRYNNKRAKKGTSVLVKPDGKKLLIWLVSNPNSAKFAIEYHFVTHKTLEIVWLILSNEIDADKFAPPTHDQVQPIITYCQDSA